MARLQIAYLQSQMNLGRVENAYHDALRAAIAAQDFGLVAKSGASLAWEAADAADFERAHRWLAHATAASVAAGGEDDLVSYVDNARGHVHGAAGETEQEVAAFRRHLEATQRVHGLRSSPVATAQNNLAAALYRTGEYDEAASLGEQALEFARRELGPRHPSVVIYALTVSSCRADQGRLEEAIRLGREALDIARDVLGENHPNTLTVMNGLATILVYDGQYNRAIELHRKVLATWEGAGAPDSVKLAVSRGNLGLALWHAGELEEANDLLVRSLTELEANLGPTHPFTASARVWIADLRIDLGDAAEVIEGLEAAVVSESDGEASTRAAAQFALARALWETGGDRDRSLALAGDAHTATKATPDRMQAERIGDWLRERGRLPVEQTGDTGAEGRK
jgi:tetratricopeptide (TPR) repeat protein